MSSGAGNMAKKLDEMDMDVQRFESMIDKNDPDQVKMLEEIKEHTRRLHQLRGDWNKPSTHRNWNSSKVPELTKAPIEDDSYRYLFPKKGTSRLPSNPQSRQPNKKPLPC